MSIKEQLANFPLPAVFLDEGQQQRLERYYSLLLEWNERMNLVSRKSIDRAFNLHFVDSVAIALFGLRHGRGPFFDLGTGGGFPGLIFSALFPGESMTLYERSTKKQTFLREVMTQLELPNTVLKDDPTGTKHDGTFFARAVLPDEEFFSYFSTILKKGSLVIFNSGLNRELRVKPTGFQMLEEECYQLPGDEGGRRVQLFLFQG